MAELSQAKLDQAAYSLNSRPRQALGRMTPSQKLAEALQWTPKTAGNTGWVGPLSDPGDELGAPGHETPIITSGFWQRGPFASNLCQTTGIALLVPQEDPGTQSRSMLRR
jgi:hypothetical protein